MTYRLSDGQEVELGRSGKITADDLDLLHAALRKARDTGPLTRSKALRRRLRSGR